MKKRNWRLMLRRVLNLVFSRLVITVTLVLLQVFWLFLGVPLARRLFDLAQRRGAGAQRHYVPGAYPAGFHRAGV